MDCYALYGLNHPNLWPCCKTDMRWKGLLGQKSTCKTTLLPLNEADWWLVSFRVCVQPESTPLLFPKCRAIIDASPLLVAKNGCPIVRHKCIDCKVTWSFVVESDQTASRVLVAVHKTSLSRFWTWACIELALSFWPSPHFQCSLYYDSIFTTRSLPRYVAAVKLENQPSLRVEPWVL